MPKPWVVLFFYIFAIKFCKNFPGYCISRSIPGKTKKHFTIIILVSIEELFAIGTGIKGNKCSIIDLLIQLKKLQEWKHILTVYEDNKFLFISFNYRNVIIYLIKKIFIFTQKRQFVIIDISILRKFPYITTLYLLGPWMLMKQQKIFQTVYWIVLI